MADQELESGQEVSEAQEQPSPEVLSVPSGAKQASAQPVDEDALAERVAARVREAIQPDIERGIQSTKDKRFRVLEGIDPDTLGRFKDYLAKNKGDVDAAYREMRIDDVLDRGRSEEVDRGRSASAGPSEKRMERYVRRILSSAGIPFKDPEYLKVVEKFQSKGSFDEDEFFDEVDDLVERRTTKQERQESPEAGSVVAEGGRTSPGRPDLVEKYKAEMMAARGKGAMVGREIKAKYRKLGVEVDRIVLA